jgi:hypothetical protein
LLTSPIATIDSLYLRFIGDRSIGEKDFGRIQKDGVTEMKKWASRLKVIRKEQGRRRKSINLS